MPTVKMKQLITGTYRAKNGSVSFTVIGLSESGRVYRFNYVGGGWEPWSMEVLQRDNLDVENFLGEDQLGDDEDELEAGIVALRRKRRTPR